MAKPKKEKKSRSPRKISAFEEKVYWGPEPKWSGKMFFDDKEYQNDLGFALNWYSYNTTNEEQKQYVLDYVDRHDSLFPRKFTVLLKKLEDRLFASLGSLARCALLEAPLTSDQKTSLNKRIHALREYIVENTKQQEPKIKVDPVVSNLIEKIDIIIDGFMSDTIKSLKKIDVQKLVQESKANSSQLAKVVSKYQNLLRELHISNTFEDSDEVDASDPNFQIFEAYSHLTVEQGEALIHFLNSLSSTQSIIPKRERIQRKPRKKKIKSTETLLKKFTYRQSDTDLRVRSVSPSSFLGAKGLLVYHVDSRKVCVFYAKDDTGLQVSGSSVRNYDEEKSYCKMIRKPLDIIPNLVVGTRTAAEKLLEKLHVVPQIARSKVNDDTLLLRTF